MTNPQQAKELLRQAAERQARQRETVVVESKRIAQERRAAIEAMRHPENAPQ